MLEGRLVTGSTIFLLARDLGHRYVYFRGTWEEPTTRFLRSVARHGWTVLDVGANAGYFSLLAYDLGGPRSNVHAFEPNPEVSGLIERSARRLAPGALTVVRAAVGDRVGTTVFHLTTDARNSGLSSLRSDVMADSEPAVVDMVTLDGYCAEHGLTPDVIKVDVEGCEVQVVQGARQLLAAGTVSYLICEFEPERAPAEPLIRLLAELGYAPRAITPTGGLTVEIKEEFQNLVFLRDGNNDSRTDHS
jgi:FkbM family methyltransferase